MGLKAGKTQASSRESGNVEEPEIVVVLSVLPGHPTGNRGPTMYGSP